ncbi:MAG: Hpt domain-containing protein [Rhodobacteraceae bacterium]|nr:Hpt domain-containing protein [Paracoccaceae bacterium]
MINWLRVQELENDVGAEDLKEVIELFLEEVDEGVDRLRSGAEGRNLADDLHFLKGSALTLGFDGFADACGLGEKIAAAGQANQVDLAGIVQAYDQSRACFLDRMAIGMPPPDQIRNCDSASLPVMS